MQDISFTVIFHDSNSPDGIFTMNRQSSPAIFLYTPRELINEAKNAKEIQGLSLGIYLLYGAGMVYIGQTTKGVERLIQHDRKKDFWTCAFMMLAPIQNFDKNMISCLESNAIEHFHSLNQYCVTNERNPNPLLPYHIEPTAREFLKQFLFFIRFKTLRPRSDFVSETKDRVIPPEENTTPPPIRIKYKPAPKLKKGDHDTPPDIVTPPSPPTNPQTAEPYFYCQREFNNKTIRARLVIRGQDEYVLLKGSCINFDIPVDYGSRSASTNEKLNALRQQLFAEGKIIATADGSFILIEDYVFNNPNVAGMFVVSTGFSGRSGWKTKDGEEIRHFMPEQRAKGFSAK